MEHKRADKWFYKINRDNPVIKKASELAEAKPKQAIEILLCFIEETIPSKSIYIKEAEEPENQGQPFEGVNLEHMTSTIKLIFENLTSSGKSVETAKAILLNTEPFNHFPHLIDIVS